MLFSIILVNFNGEKFLKNCIESFFENSFDDFELFVVDNNSSDSSRKVINFLSQKYPFKKIFNRENLGFGKTINKIYPFLRGKIILWGNVDIYLSDNFFTNLKKYISEFPNVCGFAPLLLNAYNPDYIDSTGIIYEYVSLRPFDRGQGKKISDFKMINKKILGCTGALSIYRKKCLDELIKKDGYLFDEKINLYYEDVDLAFRLYNYGYKTIFCRDLIAFHFRKQSYRQDNLIEIQSFFNRWYVLRKNLKFCDFFKGFPLNICWEFGRIIKISLKNPSLLYNILSKLVKKNKQ